MKMSFRIGIFIRKIWVDRAKREHIIFLLTVQCEIQRRQPCNGRGLGQIFLPSEEQSFTLLKNPNGDASPEYLISRCWEQPCLQNCPLCPHGVSHFTPEYEVVYLGVVKLGVMPDPWSFLEMTFLIGKE